MRNSQTWLDFKVIRKKKNTDILRFDNQLISFKPIKIVSYKVAINKVSLGFIVK